MADLERDRSITKVLGNLDQELNNGNAPTPTPTLSPSRANVVESFAQPKYRNTSNDAGNPDTLEQIQQDLRKSLTDIESRFKTLMDEFKRAAS